MLYEKVRSAIWMTHCTAPVPGYRQDWKISNAVKRCYETGQSLTDARRRSIVCCIIVYNYCINRQWSTPAEPFRHGYGNVQNAPFHTTATDRRCSAHGRSTRSIGG